LDGELHQIDHVADAQFAHEAGTAGINSLRTAIQLHGDLFVAQVLYQQVEYLMLAGTQWRPVDPPVGAKGIGTHVGKNFNCRERCGFSFCSFSAWLVFRDSV
jgi:hypothetical protein